MKRTDARSTQCLLEGDDPQEHFDNYGSPKFTEYIFVFKNSECMHMQWLGVSFISGSVPSQHWLLPIVHACELFGYIAQLIARAHSFQQLC